MLKTASVFSSSCCMYLFLSLAHIAQNLNALALLQNYIWVILRGLVHDEGTTSIRRLLLFSKSFAPTARKTCFAAWNSSNPLTNRWHYQRYWDTTYTPSQWENNSSALVLEAQWTYQATKWVTGRKMNLRRSSSPLRPHPCPTKESGAFKVYHIAMWGRKHCLMKQGLWTGNRTVISLGWNTCRK